MIYQFCLNLVCLSLIVVLVGLNLYFLDIVIANIFLSSDIAIYFWIVCLWTHAMLCYITCFKNVIIFVRQELITIQIVLVPLVLYKYIASARSKLMLCRYITSTESTIVLYMYIASAGSTIVLYKYIASAGSTLVLYKYTASAGSTWAYTFGLRISDLESFNKKSDIYVSEHAQRKFIYQTSS